MKHLRTGENGQSACRHTLQGDTQDPDEVGCMRCINTHAYNLAKVLKARQEILDARRGSFPQALAGNDATGVRE